MKSRARLAAAIALSALFAAGIVRADTAPDVWSRARDPGERARWALHLEVRRILVRDLEKERVPEADRRLLTTSAESVIDDPTIGRCRVCGARTAPWATLCDRCFMSRGYRARR